MKKMFVAFGIAIAVICGVFAIANTTVADAEETNPVTVTESVTSYLAEEYPDSTIDDVDVRRVEKDAAYGEMRVDVQYTIDGTEAFSAISSIELGDFAF